MISDLHMQILKWAAIIKRKFNATKFNSGMLVFVTINKIAS